MKYLNALLAFCVSVCAFPVYAVDAIGVFELEGNAVQDATNPPDDWETLYNGGGNQTTFSGIIVDKNGADNIFTGGGSNWPWRNVDSVPAAEP
jgi:hypothetical protein